MTKEEEKYTTLDTEQCKWWVNNLFGMAKEQACNSHNFDDAEEMQSAEDKIIKSLEIVEEFERAQENADLQAEIGRVRRALAHQTINSNATTEEIAQSFKADVEAVKDYLPKCNSMELLKELPPVTPTKKWIPVSERLPKDRDWYLGIFKEHDTGWINPLPFVCDYVGEETKATTKEFWILHGFTDTDNPNGYYKNLDCVAWQPLPEPYEEK